MRRSGTSTRISSRPRLLVKSGETASIDVGNEIPVVTRTTDSDQQTEGTTNVLQEVSYRKTGVQLEIKPLVQANGLVDLQISQQLSEARPSADTSLAGSPTILNRQISTSLTLRDGGSLLMGGLISGNQSAGETGVPVLGQLPVLGPAIDVDKDPLPDVVLEVDHTTDVRRRKLGIYKESGFPEIWVLVPWEASVRAPALTIHVRRVDGYREEAASRAFPGWKAEEIHRALTENPLSEPTWRALERTALAMGAREGTRPEDDPITRSVSEKAEVKGYARGRKEGHDEGRNEGRDEGRDEGRREMLAANVLAVLKARGIEAAPDFTEDRDLFSGLSGDALMAAAMACTGEADFRRRVREQ